MNSINRNVTAGLVGLAIGFTPSMITSMFGEMQSEWYRGLAKPALMPSGWVFSIVWTVLYFTLGIVGRKIYRINDKKAFALFVAHMFLNLCWQPIFIFTQNLQLSFGWIMLVLGSLIALVILIRQERQIIALLVPYLLWITFATFLSYRIVALNY